MRTLSLLSTAGLLTFCLASLARAAEVETLLDGLANPCGVAIQPETEQVFVSDSGGGRIIRLIDGNPEDVIVGLAKDAPEESRPLSLAFLNPSALLVFGVAARQGQEQLLMFQVPRAGSERLSADAATASYQLAGKEQDRRNQTFCCLAVANGTALATCSRDDAKGWVSRAVIKNGEIASFERFIATREVAGVKAPAALTVSPRGEVVVGQMGEIEASRDSLLSFYNAHNGTMLLRLEAGLYDLTALAYSPDGQLYATDFAANKTDEGGLFHLVARLVRGKQCVEAKKILALDKPTAMTFGKDGLLYLTVLGTAERGSDRPPGQLLKIAL